MIDLKYHNVGITKMMLDERSDRIWSTDESGKAISWDARIDTEFVVRVRLNPEVQGRILDLAVQCHMDAVRLWTLASNGINFSWWSEFDRAGYEMEKVVESMQEIIDNDAEEISGWKKKVSEVEQIERLRQQRCVDALHSLRQNSLRQAAYCTWRKWMEFRVQISKRQEIAEVLSAITLLVQRNYYHRLYNYCRRTALNGKKSRWCKTYSVKHETLCSACTGVKWWSIP